MFNPMKNVQVGSAWKAADKISAGAHNTLLQGAAMSYGASSAWGAGVGAAYGGIEGAMSYDGSFVGGAVHGAMVGGVAGAAFRGASGVYTHGAGAKAGVADSQAFAWKNFSNGWSNPKP